MAKSVAMCLQEKLKLLSIQDPFLVRNSEQVLDFFRSHEGQGLCAFSVDIKDLYYSIPHDALLSCIEECIDQQGPIAFQNASGISVNGFIELLKLYLKSTFIVWDEKPYLQKDGICIGSCIAPILSDLFLARLDRSFADIVKDTNVINIFRYVDDFLIVLNSNDSSFKDDVLNVLNLFRNHFSPLELTFELPENRVIQFLDISITMHHDRTCWMFKPRGEKPLLPFHSAHSKLVKRSIASLSFFNCLKKSCPHLMHESFSQQCKRLENAGYPSHVLVSVAEGVLKKVCNKKGQDNQEAMSKKEKVAVIPYFHKFSHNLKKIAQRSGARVVFSAPKKLSHLCTKHFKKSKNGVGCTKKHRKKFVHCIENVIYQIPLSCGKQYVGQTGRCLNDRLREHGRDVDDMRGKGLSVHCRSCHCIPLLEQCMVLKVHNNRLTREIIEAEWISLLKDDCVSTPSVSLMAKELAYLADTLC